MVRDDVRMDPSAFFTATQKINPLRHYTFYGVYVYFMYSLACLIQPVSSTAFHYSIGVLSLNRT